MNGSERETGTVMREPRTTAHAPSPEMRSASEDPMQPPPGRWARQRLYAFDPRRKSPVLASFLSLAPGLGQVYIGYYRLGFIHILVVASIITIMAQGITAASPLLGVFLAFFWLYNIVDAGRRAALYNQALEGGESIELPTELPQPTGQGSLAAGVVLVAVGGIFLSNTVFDVSLQWVEDWWPVAPILLGIYLVGRSIQDRAKRAAEESGSG